MKATEAQLSELTEATFGDPARKMGVDRDKQIISGVKCLGRESKNGRVYTDQALDDARGFYEGIDVNLDHPPGDALAERRMVDGFGVLRDVRATKEGVFADLHYLGSHPMAEVIAERAEKFPGNFGMSHNATGRVREDRDTGKLIVEGLERVESVDIVRRPATNAGLFESESQDRSESAMTKAKDDKKKTVRSVLEAHPKDELAATFLLKLEEAEFKAVGEAVLEDGATLKDAVCRVLVESFSEKSADLATSMARVHIITEAKPADRKADFSTNDLASLVNAAVAEAIAPFKLEEEKRRLLESKGLMEADLNAPQRKWLAKAESVKDAEDLLETWNVKPASNGRERPAIGSRRLAESEGDDVPYEQMRDSIRPKVPAA